MARIVDYKVVAGMTVEDLSARVQQAMDEPARPGQTSYVPYDSPSVDAQAGVIAQTLVAYGEAPMGC